MKIHFRSYIYVFYAIVSMISEMLDVFYHIL